VPIFGDGTEGPAHCSSAMFEAYNRATEGDDVEVATESMALQRAQLEWEVERMRRGLSAR
jgi:hypothetical protein